MSDSDVTRVLNAADCSDEQRAADLLPLVYEELRRLASRHIDNEPAGQTLTATALVHEAYVRLVDRTHQQNWNSLGHFYGAAAESMRRILVDRARRKKRVKHGGEFKRVDLSAVGPTSVQPKDDILALDEALTELAKKEPEKAELVKLRYFAGLSLEEAAKALRISRATASRYWTYSRAWLFEALSR